MHHLNFNCNLNLCSTSSIGGHSSDGKNAKKGKAGVNNRNNKDAAKGKQEKDNKEEEGDSLLPFITLLISLSGGEI